MEISTESKLLIEDIIERSGRICSGSCKTLEELENNLKGYFIEKGDSVLITEFSPSSGKYLYTLYSTEKYQFLNPRKLQHQK